VVLSKIPATIALPVLREGVRGFAAPQRSYAIAANIQQNVALAVAKNLLIGKNT
jgi:hypothetical protein